MATPVITSSIGLTLQALDAAGDVIFNRKILGLQNTNTTEANYTMQQPVPISTGITLNLPNVVAGFYIRNLDPNAILTVACAGTTITGSILIGPGGMFLTFMPGNLDIGIPVLNITSTVDGSVIEYAFWA